MGMTQILGLLGGLALFLYGITMMSEGLEAAAGDRLKKILERLTSNRFVGVAMGTVITALIQSSSATTVMVISFVNSSLMTLQQAVWVIMGANIGTTITGQMIALDLGGLAPLFAFIGVLLMFMIKKSRGHHFGQILAGLGVLLIGMNMMSSSMAPLRDVPGFVALMTQFENPILGILGGMVFTAIVQSSSASMGILQALAISGVLDLPSAIFVLMGQNIGTCVSALLASLNANRNAKRATLIHVLFNIIGTAIFTVIVLTTDFTSWMMALTPNSVVAQIANTHTIFNIATTLVLLPFGTYLAMLATKILPEREDETADVHQLLYINQIGTAEEGRFGYTTLVVNAVWRELERMAEMVRECVDESFEAILEGKTKRIPKIRDIEEYVDFLNKEISTFISRVMVYEQNQGASKLLVSFFGISTNLERISDHAMNIGEYSKYLSRDEFAFSEAALDEISQMKDISLRAVDLIMRMEGISVDDFAVISALEQRIDDLTVKFRDQQIERMRGRECAEESSIIYSELLTDFERIGDHVLNVGKELVKTGVPA